MEKLREGQRFNEVAAAYSEDKARQGVSTCTLKLHDVVHTEPEHFMVPNFKGRVETFCKSNLLRITNQGVAMPTQI